MPVFFREGVQRQRRNADGGGGFNVERTEVTPARWPATRGKCRLRAQRPFPSMMMAMCLGSRAGSSLLKTSASLRSSPAGIVARKLTSYEC